MMLDKKIAIGITALLLLSSMMMLSGIVSAELEKPEWHEGDYWEYTVSRWEEYLTASGQKYVEVKQEKTITIEGSQYNARMVTLHLNMSGQYMGSSYTFERDTIKYYRESDMSYMKGIVDSTTTGHEEYVYSPPFVGMDYPITVGKEWERHTTITIANSSGTKTEDVDFYYKCTGETDVNTKAGLFSCYAIKAWWEEKGGNNYSIWYQSPDAGYQPVMQEEYEDGEKTYQEKLTSFKYTKPSQDNGGNDGIPGFEITFLIIAIASIILFKRRNKRNQ